MRGKLAFTKEFSQGDRAKRVQAAIAAKIKRGQTSGSGSYRATMGDFFGDIVVAGSEGAVGNLPETFVGSFDYSYHVTGLDSQDQPIVSIQASNDTTSASATRVPGANFSLEGGLDTLMIEHGWFLPVHQDLLWTAVVPK